tara:strand:+ start:207 stop:428 length:222 start_codon:yes stop_codon:yes gene_type:complete
MPDSQHESSRICATTPSNAAKVKSVVAPPKASTSQAQELAPSETLFRTPQAEYTRKLIAAMPRMDRLGDGMPG